MHTTLLLIRHASHDWLGKGIAGRLRGVTLNSQGRTEASTLADRLQRFRISRICASPRQRAQETAAPLARSLSLEIVTLDWLDEVDCGAWTGKTFDALRADAAWRTWCEQRSLALPPDGESIAAVQSRMVAGMRELAERYPDETIVLVSHADVIKAALAYYLSLSLDDLERFDIAPASISVLALGADWAQVRSVNALTPML